MGIEHTVTRWYIQQQLILAEIALLEGHLRYSSLFGTEYDSIVDARTAEWLFQLGKARGKLSSLGPSPKPMMG